MRIFYRSVVFVDPFRLPVLLAEKLTLGRPSAQRTWTDTRKGHSRELRDIRVVRGCHRCSLTRDLT
jgi:hypothetical protein